MDNGMAGQQLHAFYPEDTSHMGLTSEVQAVIYSGLRIAQLEKSSISLKLQF